MFNYNIRTEIPVQILQTQIWLLQMEQSDLGLEYLLIQNNISEALPGSQIFFFQISGNQQWLVKMF